MSSSADPEIEALSKVCGALAHLDSDEVRRRVLDFAYAKFGLKTPKKASHTRETEEEQEDEGSDDEGGDDLLSRFDHTTPADNVTLLAAKHYSQFGNQPFTVIELKQDADGAGLVVPARIDMTLKGAGSKGKRFYQKFGKGQFKVTVHGEKFLKETYEVKKGTKKKVIATEKGE